ncbi:prenyltransferase/squalene oxidase repeat-containing protein [Streptomyces antibioticus]|uniref:prenyltransferase/squalene oxidase repeat-containing protein n=1 Tax=Streptomyces antibioticus TaxID=1890 RepID=UPI0036760DC9
MKYRHRAAALAATAVVLAGAGPAAAASSSPAPSPTPSVVIPDGLYGTTDPTYDGVWRQSLALLAQESVGVTPADEAVAWLAGQQCANGAFAAFRAEAGAGKPCDTKLMVDTNSTAAATQALAALGGHDAEVRKAVTWLKSVQNADGGWGYTPGGASDANSTSVVTGALAQGGVTVPNLRKDGKSPYDALHALALPCDGKDGGAFAYQPGKKGELAANADATAAAVLGLLSEPLTGSRQDDSASPAACTAFDASKEPEKGAANGAGWLAEAMAKDGHLTSALPGAEDQPDYGNTADAIVALSSSGLNDQAEAPLRWLEANFAQWAKDSGPAAYAQLVFVANAARGADARDFGGQDLVELLNATGPAPKAVEKKDRSTASAEKAEKAEKKDDDGLNAAYTIGGGLLVGAAIGFVLMVRGRKRRQS